MKSNNVYARYYLSHHGIKGQKWGVMNGPPYPLGASAKSYSQKKAEKEQFHLSDRQKTALKIGTAAVAACLAGYALYKTGALDNFTASGKVAVDGILRFGGSEPPTVPKELAQNKIPKSMSDAFGDNSQGNPLRHTNAEEDCTNVFLAAYGRFKGKDVYPGFQTNSDGAFKGNKINDIFNLFSPQTDKMGNSLLKTSKGSFCDSYEKVSSVISKRRYPDGSFGALKATFNIQGKTIDHTVTWRIENGKVLFGDKKNGLNAQKYFNFIAKEKDVYFFRADDLDLDWKKCSETNLLIYN